MAVIEYTAIASKTVVKDGRVYVTSAVEGGKTVRMIFGLAPLAAIIETVQKDLLQIEDGAGE